MKIAFNNFENLITSISRIHFLQNDSYLLPNKVRILGTTLWSHVPEQTASIISRSVNDYYQIKTLVENDVERRNTRKKEYKKEASDHSRRHERVAC